MNKPLVFGIGEIVWDCLPEGRKLGGAPVNFCYYAGKMGAESYPVSAVGNDSLGEETLNSCRGFGLDTRFIERNSLPTSRVLVTLDVDGIPQYEIIESVAWDSMNASSQVLEAVSRADAVCWGSLAGRSDTSFKAVSSIVDATPEGCVRVFDINLRQKYYSREKIAASLERAKVLKLNEDELPVLQSLFLLDSNPSTALQEIAKRWKLDYVVYTCGASFSEIHSASGILSHLKTPKVDVIDTVGAGDSFTAVFVTSILKGESVPVAHERAVKVAAFVCTRPGAIVPLDE